MKGRKGKRKIALLALSSVLAIQIAGASCIVQAQESTKDSVIISMDPESEPSVGFDPILGWATAEHTHDPLIQSTLLVTTDDLTIGYDLATEYEISEDGLTWTFKIRDDVKFTNGEPLTASDVAFTYNNAKEQVVEADFSMLDSVEAIDDTTVVFHLNKPYSVFAYLAAVVGIVPDESYDQTIYGENPIGSGRYMLKQWDKGEQVILEANPDYYGEKANIKNVTVVFMGEEASYAAAQAGEVDVAYTQPNYTQQPIEGYNITSYRSQDIRGIVMPCEPEGSSYVSSSGETRSSGDDVTSIKSVRQALSYAIDREAMVEDILYGYGSVAYSNCVGEKWESEDMVIPYDVDKAKEIMESDGWVLGEDGIYERDGLKAEFDMLYDSTNAVRTGLAIAASEMALDAGIKLNAIGSTWDEIKNVTHDTAWICGAGRQDPGDLIGRYYTGRNTPGYSNETVDGYIDQALAENDLEKSFEYWKKAQWDGTTGVSPLGDAPWVWMVNCDHVYFTREGLNPVDEKIHPHGFGWTITNNVDKWYWE